jgi:hypothetical protein
MENFENSSLAEGGKKTSIIRTSIFKVKIWPAGVQSKNNEYHIVDKVENVCVNKYIFNLIDNVVFVVLALYSSLLQHELLGKSRIVRPRN